MNRRDLTKGILAVPLVALLPSVVKAEAPKPNADYYKLLLRGGHADDEVHYPGEQAKDLSFVTTVFQKQKPVFYMWSYHDYAGGTDSVKSVCMDKFYRTFADTDTDRFFVIREHVCNIIYKQEWVDDLYRESSSELNSIYEDMAKKHGGLEDGPVHSISYWAPIATHRAEWQDYMINTSFTQHVADWKTGNLPT